jgi:membrane protein DedA with SNARE-associated domain
MLFLQVAAGVFKMDTWVYLCVTLGGYFLKDTGYILAGYFGFAKISTLWRDIDHIKWMFDSAVWLAIGIALYLLYRHRHKGKHTATISVGTQSVAIAIEVKADEAEAKKA